MSENGWYYWSDNKVQGPFSRVELMDSAARGELQSETLVRSGNQRWRSADCYSFLSASLTAFHSSKNEGGVQHAPTSISSLSLSDATIATDSQKTTSIADNIDNRFASTKAKREVQNALAYGACACLTLLFMYILFFLLDITIGLKNIKHFDKLIALVGLSSCWYIIQAIYKVLKTPWMVTSEALRDREYWNLWRFGTSKSSQQKPKNLEFQQPNESDMVQPDFQTKSHPIVLGTMLKHKRKWTRGRLFGIAALGILIAIVSITSYFVVRSYQSNESNSPLPLASRPTEQVWENVPSVTDTASLSQTPSQTSSRVGTTITSNHKENIRDANAITDDHNRVVNKAESSSKHPNETTSSTKMLLDPATLYANSKGAVATIETKDDLGFDAYQGSGVLIDPSWIKSCSKYVLSWQELAEDSQKHPENHLFPPFQNAYLLTNQHVIRSATNAVVKLYDGGTGGISDIIMENENLDIALVHCIIGVTPKPIPHLHISTEDTAIGERVYAIGSPEGLEASLSEGIISGKREIVPGIVYIQTTAPISSGSSGGPLLNSTGKVIGITTASRREGQNLNFVIPASHIIEFLKGPCNPREIGSGTSIQAEEDYAYKLESFAHHHLLNEKGEDDWEGEPLEVIRNKIIKTQNYTEALQDLTNLKSSQFDKHAYLFHYTIGLAAEGLCSKSDIWHDGQTIEDKYRQCRNNKYQQLAKKAYMESIQLKPEYSPANKHLADCLSREGQFVEALVYGNILVERVPFCATAYKLRGDILTSLKHNLEALRDYKNAAKLSPGNPEIYYKMGEVYMFLHNDEEAIEAYETAIQLKLKPPLSGACYFGIGLIRKWMGKFEQAIACFKKAKENGYDAEECNKKIVECLRRLQ
jgi:S1-C subfamily serine protease/tetratricopeptide (TPR) repeat protein